MMVGSYGFGIGFDRFSGDQLSHCMIVCQRSSVQTSLKETICTGKCLFTPKKNVTLLINLNEFELSPNEFNFFSVMFTAVKNAINFVME